MTHSVVYVTAGTGELADNIIMREFTGGGFTFVDNDGFGRFVFGFDGDLAAVTAAIDTFVDTVADYVSDCFVDTYTAL